MKPIISKAILQKQGACQSQVDLFVELFGDGDVILTIEKAEKVAERLDWGLARRLLDDEGKAEFNRITAPAWAEYERAIAPAWAEYERIPTATFDEYERATTPAQAEYERIAAPAWADYERIAARAWATAYIATCERRKAAPPHTRIIK